MEGQKDKTTKGWTKGQMKGQTKKGMKDGKTQFHRIVLPTARGPIKFPSGYSLLAHFVLPSYLP